ncbi:hypothetical protein Tco_0664026 [Tanacetum coccineum]
MYINRSHRSVLLIHKVTPSDIQHSAAYSDLRVLQIVIMSSATSAVTYTFVYIDSEPGRAFWGADDEEISEGGIPRDEDEREPMFIHAHDPDYVREPIYPEYIPLEDKHEFPAEEQPLPPVDSPTAESPGYVTELDPKEDPEEDDANDEDEEDEEEEEHLASHLAPADSTNVYLLIEPVFPHLLQSLPPKARRLRDPSGMTTVAITSPPYLTITTPTTGERLIIAALPLPPLLPSLYIPPPADHRGKIPKSEQPPSQEGIRDVGYDIRDTWVDPEKAVPEIAPMTVGEVNTRVTELAELYEHDTKDLYALLEDAQDRLSQATHQELQTHRDHVYAHETHSSRYIRRSYSCRVLLNQYTIIKTLESLRHDARVKLHAAEFVITDERAAEEARQPRPRGLELEHQEASWESA